MYVIAIQIFTNRAFSSRLIQPVKTENPAFSLALALATKSLYSPIKLFLLLCGKNVYKKKTKKRKSLVDGHKRGSHSKTMNAETFKFSEMVAESNFDLGLDFSIDNNLMMMKFICNKNAFARQNSSLKGVKEIKKSSLTLWIL